MENIRERIKRGVLVADGANGTYLSALGGRSAEACETLNLSDPALVGRVHREYVQAGAALISSNTFSANSLTLAKPFETVEEILRAGYEAARMAAQGGAYVAADIGPVSESARGQNPEADWSRRVQREYERIADVFIALGARIFLFETFPEAQTPLKAAAYIRARVPDAYLIVSFAVLPDGRTRLGIRGEELIEAVKASGQVDAAGFNCCSGPAHLLSYASRIDFGSLAPVIMPNAGYPFREENTVVYPGTPSYFAEKLSGAGSAGFKIVGGCCGTTPAHIHALAGLIGKRPAGTGPHPAGKRETAVSAVARSGFQQALSSGKKVVLVELDPPGTSDFTKFDASTRLISECGVDAVTVADSPLARPRADSVAVAARLKRISGMDVIPHISCRDRNINAIKSALIAAHLEGVRSILAVTGDPVPDSDRGAVKSVFNLNSASLCSFVRDLNEDIFRGDEIACGCAFNVNAANPDPELERLVRKLKAGASFVLTQPVFSDASFAALARAKKETGAKIIVGILTPVSYRNVCFLANEMPGIKIPEQILRRFTPEMSREEGEEEGVRISAALAGRAAGSCDGFYCIVPFNRVGVTSRLLGRLRRAGVLPA